MAMDVIKILKEKMITRKFYGEKWCSLLHQLKVSFLRQYLLSLVPK